MDEIMEISLENFIFNMLEQYKIASFNISIITEYVSTVFTNRSIKNRVKKNQFEYFLSI